jgi:hypothetical protein
MQLNENKKTLQEEINTIFHIENDYNLTFKKAILPILVAFETALNRDFLLEKEKKSYFWAFDTSEITKAGLKERFEAYKTAKECGFITINEIRYKENMNKLEGMDIIPMSLADVIYDTTTKEYFVPNTGAVKPANEQNNTESNETVPLQEENGLNGQNFDNEGGDK